MLGAFFMLFSTFTVPLWYSEKRTMDVAQVDFAGPNLPTIAGVEAVTSLIMGIWGYCVRGKNTDHVECQIQIPYSISITDTTTNQIFLIKSSWTRGLFVHAVAAVVMAVTAFLSRCDGITYVLRVSLLGSLLGSAASGFHLVLFSHVKHEMKKMESDVGAKMRLPTVPIFMLIGMFYFACGAGDYWVEYVMRHLRSTVKDPSSAGSQEEQVPLLSSSA